MRTVYLVRVITPISDDWEPTLYPKLRSARVVATQNMNCRSNVQTEIYALYPQQHFSQSNLAFIEKKAKGVIGEKLY